MLPEKTRQTITALWDTVSAAGLAPTPYIAIEQIACLMFLRKLECESHFIDDLLLFDGQPCTWTVIEQQSDPGHYLKDVVFPWLRTLEQRFVEHFPHTQFPILNGLLDDAYFQLDVSKRQTLTSVIDLVGQLFPSDGPELETSAGEIFEALVEQALHRRSREQTITPRHLTRFMVALVEPKINSRIIDPAAGPGNHLTSALRYISNDYGKPPRDLMGGHFVGVDLDYAMARVGWINLYLHGVRQPAFVQGDAYSGRVGKLNLVSDVFNQNSYDHVISNAPWGVTVESDAMEDLGYARGAEKFGRTLDGELLFLWRSLDLLKVGGRAALVVSQKVLSSKSPSYLQWRRELLTSHYVEAIILLPYNAFKPLANTRVAVLVFRKHGTHDAEQPVSDAVWFYETGVDNENDLWDARVHFYHRKQGQEFWAQNKEKYYQPRVSSTESPYITDFDIRQPVDSIKAPRARQWLVPVRQLIGNELNPDCIEGADWSLEIDRYRPIVQPEATDEVSVMALIDELADTQTAILKRLEHLRTLVENR